MGVIQNSLNTAMATLMGGILGIKHVGQQATTNEIQKDILVNNQARAKSEAELAKNKLANQERTELINLARRQGEVKNETAELKKNISGIKGDLQYAKNQYDKLNNGPITTLEEADAYDKYGAEIPMRKKALRTANSALKSKQLEGKLIQTRISELTEKYPNALEGGKK